MIRLLLGYLLARLVKRLLLAAFGTPTDPVAGTVITVAYAVANLLNPIRALRDFTGGSDPPGSGYVVTSDSTSATSWKTVLGAITTALGGTPLLKTGGTMTGNITFSDILEGVVLAGGSHVRDDNTASTGSFQVLCEQGRFRAYNEAASPLFDADHDAGTFTFKGNTIWRADNDGAGSGLDADTVDGQHASAFPTLAGGGDFATRPTFGGDAMAVVEEGSYTGNGVTGRTISVGFVPKVVLVSWTSTSGNNSGTAILASSSAGTTVAHGNFGGSPTAGIVDTAVLAGSGFTVNGPGLPGNNWLNLAPGGDTVTYRWKAFG